MKSQILRFTTIGALLLLTACSSTKEQLGLTREAPDEFKVVRRAPLEMPPNYSLRPPAPGTSRPQETATALQAEATVFGENNVQIKKADTSDQIDAEGSEMLLLEQAGALSTDPDIRTTVDKEATEYDSSKIPVAKKLFGLGKNVEAPATLVDPVEERARIEENLEEGKPITDGETPYVED